jgi:hypothetical protein
LIFSPPCHHAIDAAFDVPLVAAAAAITPDFLFAAVSPLMPLLFRRCRRFRFSFRHCRCRAAFDIFFRLSPHYAFIDAFRHVPPRFFATLILRPLRQPRRFCCRLPADAAFRFY